MCNILNNRHKIVPGVTLSTEDDNKIWEQKNPGFTRTLK